MKKVLFILAFILTAGATQAQTFHFLNNSTTLIKTTDQSPAHWYIEIYNDLGVDTMLRWKSTFINVPSQWQINFDDQTANHPDVHDNDSADFVLQVTGAFPQKLIIGAMLNNTPADATILFEIYDPYAPSVIDTIFYNFFVTQGSANLLELEKSGIVLFKDNIISIVNGKASAFDLYDAQGKGIRSFKNAEKLDLNSLDKNQVYFIQLTQGNKTYVVKWIG